MIKVVANIVGRNEEDKYLHDVINRVSEQVDLVCFTDDHSDDNTEGVADSYGCVTMRMDEPTFMTNEGKLRQASWNFLESKISKYPQDEWYVLAIDCDEMLYETVAPIHEVVAEKPYNVFAIYFFHMWNEKQYRVDKAWHPHSSTRLFKYHKGGQFLDRALACGSEPTYVLPLVQAGLFKPHTGLMMKHLSYITDEGKTSKYERYTKIDGGAYHANAHIESIIDPNPILEDWIWG